MKLIHLSDLHYHKDKVNNREADKLLDTVRKEYPDHTLVITGDITDDGHPGQYQNALAALMPFKGKVFIVPGNHDFGAAGNFYSRQRALRFDAVLCDGLEQGGTFAGDNMPVVNVVGDGKDHLMIIALDTNLETTNPFDFACGEVGETQLSALDAILSDPLNAEMKKLVCFHHHPFIRHNPFMELRDARQLMRSLYRRVNLVLFGHRHVWQLWKNMNGIDWILASDNSPGKDCAREISLENGVLKVKDLSLKAKGPKKTRKRKSKG